MAKRARNQEKDHKNPKRSSRRQYIDPQDIDDDIDTFHKQRDIIPLDINDDDGESIDEEEEPVFDDEDIDVDEDDESEHETQFTAKIKRQQKYIKEKFGILDDETHDEEENENEEDKKEVWGGKKPHYYGGQDYEGQSSDDEALKEEEEEILRMQREKAENLSMEDFGLDNAVNESDQELTFEEISDKGKSKAKASFIKAVDSMDTFEVVKKDLNAFSKEEQMDVVYSSAPELVGLLSELNDALVNLESKINPVLNKAKSGGIAQGGIRYLEVKQLLLLAYCQAITFYLLLKSEGQPVRDHPVIARLVEIKGLLDKMEQLDGNLPSEIEEFLKQNCGAETGENKVSANASSAPQSVSVAKTYISSHDSNKADVQGPAETSGKIEVVDIEPSRNHETKEKKHKHKTDQVGVQSMEMLKLRAALEEKLKHRGVFSSFTPKPQKHSKSVNGRLETYEDFNDDAIEVGKEDHKLSNGHASKLSQLVSAKPNKPKFVSGDDDLPKRDDIGERRRKHELRVLASAGVISEDNAGHELGLPETNNASDMEDSTEDVSEDDFYREIKQKRAAKLATKAEIYTRNPAILSLPETVDGKRRINRQIEKNKGLTRSRKRDLKNPRKKYRTKHEKQKQRRKGQVQQIRKPTAAYGGEASGINAGISRSIRF